MLSKAVYEDARRRTMELYDKAAIVLTKEERDSLEVADFGLDQLDQTGLELITYVNTPSVLRQGNGAVPRSDLSGA